MFDASPSFSNNTFDSGARISACMSINSSPDGWVRYVAIEDSDGSISGTGPGFYVQNEAAITNFIEPNTCEAEDRCLLFCPGSCLRLGTVSVSQDYTTRGFKMHIQDGLKTATVLRGPIWFDEKQVRVQNLVVAFARHLVAAHFFRAFLYPTALEPSKRPDPHRFAGAYQWPVLNLFHRR